MTQDTDRQAILEQVRQFAAGRAGRNMASTFRPGEDPVPVSGKVLGPEEFVSMVDACLDGWLTTGRFNEALEKRLAEFIGCSHVRTVNSGSSANLVAFAALTSPLLGERALKAGDEVITVAAGFPTTVNPMLLYGMTPVFVDVQLGAYNIDASQLEAAVSPRTRAIMLAHTLGNPFDLDAVMALAQKHDLWVIEDCCDALGSTYRNQHVGTFGHIGTLSFYPAHHITMGEGGAVFTSDDTLVRAIESIRDWGRDCWCPPGRDNTCGRRFCWKLGDLPEGYDHKYIYSHLGYNLKISDMQAACGLAQMDRLPGFIEARRRNFDYLWKQMAELQEVLVLPEATPFSQPSWFGFPVTLRESSGVNRVDLLRYLDQHRIGTRLLFAGNLTRQPYFAQQQYRCVGNLPQTDRVMRDTFWVGVYPGLEENQLDFMSKKIAEFIGHGW
ncbi:MAG: lipopolysaccharide biosynthesis protein RfbH [Sulfuricellaceae bacterium]|nr:lipopolysaccharide biosynthesis protein RfbH [Sulfuricellaceae bacterium]